MKCIQPKPLQSSRINLILQVAVSEHPSNGDEFQWMSLALVGDGRASGHKICTNYKLPHMVVLSLHSSSFTAIPSSVWKGHGGMVLNRMDLTKARFPLPELTGDRFPLPINTGRVDWRVFPLAELTGRQHGPCWRVMETGHPSTRAVNSDCQFG